MTQYIVRGMSCAACQARVEKAVLKVPGVTGCAVSLLTNSMGVEGSASADDIIKAVTDAGYSAVLKGENAGTSAKTGQRSAGGALSVEEEALTDHETPRLLRRLAASVVFLLALMYFSMGEAMWGWPVPEFFENNPAGIGLLELLLSGIVMLINRDFFVSGSRGILNLAPNMDSLVSMGSMASYIYSVGILFLITKALRDGETALAHEYHHGLYFESAAMILALITVGKTLEAYSKGRTTDALKSLLHLAPQTASILRDGEEQKIPIEELSVGDIFVVRPGEHIPTDGIVLEGNSAIDEAMLTGESIPIDKEPGDRVSAGTVNQSGFLKCRAERVGEDTALSGIIRMVSEAAATKAPIAKAADRVAGVFVPSVICIAIVTAGIWLLLGESTGYAVARGVSVLVISCPCALGLATPVAIMVGSGTGARNGIMFKTAAALEETGRARVVALDKTGTITMGEPSVTDILTYGNVARSAFLAAAAALEEKSEHPLAKAIVGFSEKEGVSDEMPDVSHFEALTGNGVKGEIEGELFYGGSLKFISGICDVPDEVFADAEELSSKGRTPVLFSAYGMIIGMIAIADAIKPESAEAVRKLKSMGLYVVMLTGDNEKTAAHIGRLAGVDETIAGVLPGEKKEAVERLRQKGVTIMVGDGINDAPALMEADVGMAIGCGTDVAIDAADVVLTKSLLTDVPAAVKLGRAVLRNIHENLFWAFFYNVLCIPLAAGCFVKLLGWSLNPMVAAAAMSLSSIFVVTNALRLNLLKFRE